MRSDVKHLSPCGYQSLYYCHTYREACPKIWDVCPYHHKPKTLHKTCRDINAEVMWMNGDRIDGYYYVGIEGTDLRACDDGHPCFPSKFQEGADNPKKKAQVLARKINRQLKQVKKRSK